MARRAGHLGGAQPFSPDRLAGLLVALFGAWFLWQATELRSGPGYAAVGPRIFPTIVGGGLLGSGLALVLASPRGGSGTAHERMAAADPAGAATDWPTLLATAAALAGYVALFRPLGFIVASTVFLAAVARILGSERWPRDLLAGTILGLVTYAVFTLLLGLELPAGPLEAPIRLLRGFALSGGAGE